MKDSPQKSYFQHSDCSRPLTVSLVDCKTHSLFHTLTFLAPETPHICNACDTNTIYSIYRFTEIVSLHSLEFVKNIDSHQSGGKLSSQRRAARLLSTSPSACGRPTTWPAAPPVTETERDRDRDREREREREREGQRPSSNSVQLLFLG